MVMQTDGSLKEMSGDIYKERRRKDVPNAEQEWKRYYFKAKNAGMTFRQAEALFAKDHNWNWPRRDLPLMPKTPANWCRKVASVDHSDLIQ